MPYDTVTVQGLLSQPAGSQRRHHQSGESKGAYAFFIVRQVDANQGGNQRITAYIYKKMLKTRAAGARRYPG